MSLKIVNAPMKCATGGVSEFILLEIGPTYRYENGVRSDSVIGQTLVVGNRKTFEKFRVKIPHLREKITPEEIRNSSEPVMVRFIKGCVSDYVMDGRLGLSFVADDYEIISDFDSLDFGGGQDA